MKTTNSAAIFFFTIVSAWVSPVLGSEIPYAREFTVTNLSGTPVQGTIDVPSTLASFTVQSSLAGGLRISVDASWHRPGSARSPGHVPGQFLPANLPRRGSGSRFGPG